MAKNIQLWIARRIRQLRKRQGLTQEQLAERARVAVRYLQSIESLSKPKSARVEIIERIAKAMGMTLSEFFK